VVLTGLVLAKFGFSIETLFSAAIAKHPKGDGIMGPIGLIDGPGTAASLALTQVLGPAGLPHILMRFFTVPDVRAARKSAFVATAVIGLFSMLMVVIGFGTIALLTDDPAYMNAAGQMKGGTNMAALNLAHVIGGDFLLGIIAAVAFCTILAVVSGLTLAAAATISHDLYATLRKTPISDREEIKVSRIGAALFGAVCIALSVVFQDMNVNILSTFAISVAASATFPVLVLALFWKGLTTAGAVIGGTTGLISAVAALVLGPGIWTAVLHFPTAIFPYQFPTILSFPLAMVTAVGISLLRPEKTP
jgi:cation/acetate symporter